MSVTTTVAPEINDELYAQLVETSEALDQPIRGVEARLEISSSPELQEREQAALTALRHQKNLIDAAIMCLDQCQTNLDALQETGWPAQPTVELSAVLGAEQQAENEDLTAAAAIFHVAPPLATHFRVTVEVVPFPLESAASAVKPRRK